MENYTLKMVGFRVCKNSKQGGGVYVVIAHVNCERCNKLIEEREVIEPTKSHRKRGRYYSQYSWCHHCGLYKPMLSSKEIILK